MDADGVTIEASKVAADLNENLIRDLALKSRLIDTKVCAVDETWSGLKLGTRLKDRAGQPGSPRNT